MDALFQVGLMNALVATLLATAVFVISRRWRNPVVIHALCLVVLLKFVAPPLLGVLIPQYLVSSTTAGSETAPEPTTFDAPAAEPRAELPGNETEVAMSPPAEVSQFIDDTNSATLPPNDAEAVVASAILIPAPIAATLPESVETTAADNHVSAPTAVGQSGVKWDENGPTWAKQAAQSLWIVGIFALAVYIARRFWTVAKVLRTSTSPEECLQQSAGEVAERMGLRRTINLRIVDVEMSPVVFCPLFRPVVLIPKRLLEEFSKAQIETILAHELAHLRRKDHRVRQLELLVSVLFWWCPVVWWINRLLRRAEEACCDAEVLRAYPKAGRMYASVLLQTVEMLRTSPTTIVPIGSTLGHASELRRRIEQILDVRGNAAWSWRARVCIVAVACLLPFSFRAAGDQREDNGVAGEHATGVSPDESIAPQDSIHETNGGAALEPKQAVIAFADASLNRTTELSPQLLQVLQDWESHTAKIKRLHVALTRRVYDTTFQVEKLSEGELNFDAPANGRIALRGVTPAKNQVSQHRDSASQKPFALVAGTSEKWICDGRSIWQILEADRTIDETPLNPSVSWAEIVNGPLPLLWGTSVEQAKSRYEFAFSEKPAKRNSTEIWLNVKPRLQRDAQNWRSAQVILDANTYFPLWVKLVDPAGKIETVYQFQNPQINSPIATASGTYSPPKSPEWRYRQTQPLDATAENASKGPEPADKTAESTDRNEPVANDTVIIPEPQAWGTLTGRFIYDGPGPEPKRIEPGRDAAAFAGAPILDESLVVGDGGGIANVFIYLRDKQVPVHSSYEISKDEVKSITVRNGRFEPHAMTVRTTQSFLIANTEAVSTNAHLQSLASTPFNQLLAPKSENAITIPLRKEPYPAKLSSDIHNWMNAYVLVRDNPYAVVSGADGKFRLENVPVGEWELQLWHEKKGYLPAGPIFNSHGRMKVRIQAGTNDLGVIKVSPANLEKQDVPQDFQTRKAPAREELGQFRRPSRWQTHRRDAPYGELGFPGDDYGPHWEFLCLVTHPAAQRELDLSAEQIEYLKPVYKGFVAKTTKWSTGGKNPELLQLEFDVASRIVTDAQKARVDQIKVQRRGIPALFQKDVQERLGLTADQAQRVQSLWNDHAKTSGNLSGNGPRESLYTTWKQVLELLSDEQHRKFEEMTGRLISTSPEPPTMSSIAPRRAQNSVAETDQIVWSEPVNGVQARLLFVGKRKLNDTLLIDTYLEFRNVTDVNSTIEIPLKSDQFKFTVTDSTGKEFPRYNGPYDGSSVEPGLIRLPYDGSVRLNIRMHGAGISKDSAAMLDLLPAIAWSFPRDSNEKYFLEAEIKIDSEKEPPRDRRPYWSGTIKIPKTAIRLKEIHQRESTFIRDPTTNEIIRESPIK